MEAVGRAGGKDRHTSTDTRLKKNTTHALNHTRPRVPMFVPPTEDHRCGEGPIATIMNSSYKPGVWDAFTAG